MENIDKILQENNFKIKQLLRRSRIIGEPSMETIKRGFDQGGETFMLKLLEIITPNESSFSSIVAPITTKPTAAATVESPGKFWAFWEKVLSGVNSTGEAINKFKTDLGSESQTSNNTPEIQTKTAGNTNLLYMAAIGFILLILIILIFR